MAHQWHKLDAKEGITKLKQQVACLKREHADAAASLLEAAEKDLLGLARIGGDVQNTELFSNVE